MIGKISDVLMECADVAASERFYVEKLGLKIRVRGEGWVSLEGGTASITMWQGPSPKVIIGFDGADLAAVHADLTAKGVKLSELMEHPGGKHYDLVDPDGNLLMIADH